MADTDTSMRKCRGVGIEHLSIAQLQKHMTDGTFTSRDLTECYLERIRRVNPVLKAVIEVNPDALSIADKYDGEQKEGNVRGPLQGIPFVAKDNICTKDKMQILIGTRVADDALVIKKLRRGGAYSWSTRTFQNGHACDLHTLRKDTQATAGNAETLITSLNTSADPAAEAQSPHLYQFVKVDFYNDLKAYLASLAENPMNLKSLEDIIELNKKHAEEEGGLLGLHGAWPTGQDTFDHVAETLGLGDEIYQSALKYIRQKSRGEGIDAVLTSKGRATRRNPLAENRNDVQFDLAIIQTSGREDLLVKYGSAMVDLMRGRSPARFLNLDANNYMYVGGPPED
ncbi:hypothetical protein SAPIO_CDS0598 [Scedosporium apiospermum]|uniref:Amidase domain-containing protein n=1 Tax=Pseudallescheria apiosperma TaxID=563466 RepID=A0A084GG41_PSEDA|nr:uncharacterized protein SAPIO_CDS0598 [Scedosporium apiospermum]KEZ46303.1 hypothetical protein SAPIO_CDS0598 [Scedosporium apiospermum]